jgi:4'-phosphopantetheinyl transferase
MDDPIPLGPDEIHLWLAFHDDIADARLHAAWRALLDAAEQAQEPRFHFARDRRRFLITRALVRTTLSRYVPIAPQAWMFSTNAYGRPGIANADAPAAALTFNVSHTDGLIVLGVTRHRALGVDVEHVRRRTVPLAIARSYFAPEEVAALRVVPPHRQPQRFFEYWTLKEAYIKARGMGLSLPLDTFSVHYPDDRTVAIAMQPALADDPARWQFWQCRPSPEHLLAVCAERHGPQPSRLIVRHAMPMQGDTPCELDVLRASA